MAYYKICPTCGALLDVGESCDCTVESDFSRQIAELLGGNPCGRCDDIEVCTSVCTHVADRLQGVRRL